FELGANISWNDLTMDDDVVSGGTVLFKKGDRVGRSPEYTAGASLGYVFPVGANGLEGRFSASASYISRKFAPSSSDPSVRIQSDTVMGSHVGLSVGSPDHWTVELFVDNAAGDRGVPTVIEPLYPWNSSRLRPRTFGVQLGYDF